MALTHSPQIATNGLVFSYDMGNTEKSWKGQPTTNLVGDSMSIYNNASADVTATLATTGEYYRGAPIYKLTLTPTTATGVSYLTAGNNPGIGVVSGGGGGTASRYTGHSIFFKPTVPLHTSPIFTHYSNIAGWQSTSNYYSMGDGWFRAHVIWYDTVTRSDGKYWAINPASAALNVPIVTYFAGPFKEDRNDSAFVSQYVYSSRSNTQAIVDQTGLSTITTTSLTYASDGTFSFNGSSNYISAGASSLWAFGQNGTVEQWVYISGNSGTNNRLWCTTNTSAGLDAYLNGASYNLYMHGGVVSTTSAIPSNQWINVTATYNAGTVSVYFNGVAQGLTGTTTGYNITNTGALYIGEYSGGGNYYLNGKIPITRVYNRALSATEVQQNFNALRGRYGL